MVIPDPIALLYNNGLKRTETSIKGGKPVLKSTLDIDGNLIESETY